MMLESCKRVKMKLCTELSPDLDIVRHERGRRRRQRKKYYMEIVLLDCDMFTNFYVLHRFTTVFAQLTLC